MYKGKIGYAQCSYIYNNSFHSKFCDQYFQEEAYAFRHFRTDIYIYSACECVNNSGNIVVSLEILSDFVNNM
jgi:hypothetical protein